MVGRRAAAVVCALVLSAACTGSRGPEARDGEIETSPSGNRLDGSASPRPPSRTRLSWFSRRAAMDHVRKLANAVGVRVRGTRAELQASRYVASRFRALGYDVRIQAYSVDERTSRNVVATAPGAIAHPLVIGAHIDTVGGSPGANDNASGVAVVLETARIFAGDRRRRFVQFVAFGAEEYGMDGRHHVGSQAFVDGLPRKARAKLPGMVSIDMVGDGRLLIGTSGIASDIVARTVFKKTRAAGIKARYHTTCDCSDNGPFERAGIPASHLWTGPEPDFHSPSDVPANMSPADLERAGRALRAFLKALDLRMIARFRDHRKG